MKKHFTYLLCFFLINCTQMSFGQSWLSYFRGNLKADNVVISSTAGSVGGAGVGVQGYVFFGNVSDETLRTFSLNFALTNTPVQNRFKAQVGVPFEIQLDFKLAKFNNQPTILENIIVNSDNINGFKGKNNQPNINDENISFPKISFEAQPSGFNRYVYKKSFVFNEGRTESWIVFRFTTQEGTLQQSFTIVLPFVVEGLYAPIGRDNPVPIKGFFKEPAIPQLILHNPPGDGSSVTFRTLQEACRNISVNTANEESNAGNLKVTLGIAGQAGMFITAPFEFSASISAGVGTGSSVVRSNGQQNCLSIINDITTVTGAARANEGSVYMGYSSTIAYGTYPVVTISETLPRVVKLDSALMFGLVNGSASPFYYSKADILNDMQIQQNIANNTTFPKVKQEALNQIKVWRQVLAKDSANIKNATNRVLRNSFDLTGRSAAIGNSTTLSLATSDSYDVSHFLDASVGASFVIMFGGSGVEGGYEFKTKKTFGQSTSNTTNQATTVAYNLYDDDEGDSFKIKIVEDPTYGTPIFLVDDFLTRTSCPFEGGIQRDKPKLEINDSTSPTVTVSNVSLGTSGNFRVKVCNNANEIRDYGFGFVGESIVNDVSITSTAGIGSSPTGTSITKLATITAVPANGCKTTTYDVNISRRNPASPMSYQNIEFVTYPECEPSIKSSIFANINFAGPTPPSNVTVSSTSICAGSGVILSALCPATTTPTWYTSSTGGFPLGTGSSYTLISSQFPTTTTTYYVGCETVDYKRDRVATSPVVVNPIPTIQTFSSTQTICNGATANLSATCSVGSSPVWYVSNVATTGTSGASFTTPTLNTSTTYFVACEIGGASSCVSTRQQIVVNVNPVSPVPTPQANAYIASGGSVSLTATGCSGGSGIYVLKWYKASDNSLVTMPVSPTTTTNYYAKCEQALNSVICLSPASANVTVNVGNYINSIISGNWENSSTWTPSRVPLATDNVIINNHTVTITSNAANAKSVEYKAGATLKYLNAGTKLNVGF